MKTKGVCLIIATAILAGANTVVLPAMANNPLHESYSRRDDGTSIGNGRKEREGTSVGNGGDGLIQYVPSTTSDATQQIIDIVYMYDLAHYRAYYVDAKRQTYQAARLLKYATLKTRLRNILAKKFSAKHPSNEVFYKKAVDGPRGQARLADDGIPYYQLIADAVTYHISFLLESDPILAERVIQRLETLRFKRAALEKLPANPDTLDPRVAERMDFDYRAKQQERIGCATRNGNNNLVDWALPCFGFLMPLSHSAALIVHEAIYALILDNPAIQPGYLTSGVVRDVVSEAFLASPAAEDGADDEAFKSLSGMLSNTLPTTDPIQRFNDSQHRKWRSE